MSDKIKIEKNSVQETLVIPLYGRKLCSTRFPQVYVDESAADICERLDYDFGELDQSMKGFMWEFGALETAVRQFDMECEVSDYLSAHPKAAIVNLGCGLDNMPRKSDNGQCLFYNVDFPDIIEAREQIIPAGERETNIACDLTDHSWMKQVDGGNGAVFYGAGVFHYLKMADVKALVLAMAEQFPGGRLVFDTVGKFGYKMMLRTALKNWDMNDATGMCYVKDPEREMGPWSPKVAVSSKPYLFGYGAMDHEGIPFRYKLLARIGDNLMHMNIIRMDFAE